jgi:hypothetical protein
MMTDDFVAKNSIVRQIWGKGETILFIFAGAAAEFALNKAVDWLYFTGHLPADPIGRLFSTVTYARRIVFAQTDAATIAIDQITAIHKQVEKSRGEQIPDWAYRDVLFMLIDYSIRSFEVLERKLDDAEKKEVFNVFYRVGLRMGLSGLPGDYQQWLIMREDHLEHNTISSDFTSHLFLQYRKHLGWVRYQILLGVQAMVTPLRVLHLLSLSKIHLLKPLLWTYKQSRKIGLDGVLLGAILPKAYKAQIMALNIYSDRNLKSPSLRSREGKSSAAMTG